jgi:hypothetical protein
MLSRQTVMNQPVANTGPQYEVLALLTTILYLFKRFPAFPMSASTQLAYIAGWDQHTARSQQVISGLVSPPEAISLAVLLLL